MTMQITNIAKITTIIRTINNNYDNFPLDDTFCSKNDDSYRSQVPGIFLLSEITKSESYYKIPDFDKDQERMHDNLKFQKKLIPKCIANNKKM